MLTTEAAPAKSKTDAPVATPAPKPADDKPAKAAAAGADSKVPPPPIQNEEVPSSTASAGKASASPEDLSKEEAKAAAAESKAKSSAGKAAAAAAGLSRPKAPAYIRDSGVNLASMWRRGREALSKLPGMVAHFTMEYLVKYPSETVWWALTDRPKFKARMSYVWDVVKHEAQHMWLGFKLLGVDVKTSWRLVQRVLRGHTLTRRERKQLMRTTSDLFRLVPFSIFIIVPGGEALIPVALKIFPNLLPSTFASQDSKAAEQKKILQMRVELATFLSHTMEFMGQQIQTKSGSGKDGAAPAGAHGNQLMALVRSAREGRVLEAEDIVAVSRIFKDEITLENIGRHELISMARLLGISAFGTDGFLRYQIRSKIRTIKADDAEIKREGLEALSKEELGEACRERGMRASGLTEGGLRDQLQQWLDLSTRNEVPLSLLILSRALTFAAPIKDTGAPVEPAPADATAASSARSDPAKSASDPAKPSSARAAKPSAKDPVAASDGGTPSTSMERALQASIAHLGDSIVEEALLGEAERTGDTDDLSVAQMRLRSIERENALIEMERDAKEAAAEAHTLAKEAEEASSLVADARRTGDEAGLSSAMHQAASAAQAAARAGQRARDAYAELRRKAAGEVAEAVSRRRRKKGAAGGAADEDDEPYAVDAGLLAALGEDSGLRDLASAAKALRKETGEDGSAPPEDLRELGREEAEALLAMAGASALQQERARISKIKAARLRMEAVEMLARGKIDAAKAAVDRADDAEAGALGDEHDDATDDDAASQLAKDTAASRVKSALDTLLVRLEGDMEAADESLGATLTLLDRDHDGVVSADELQSAILDVLGNRNMEKAAAAIIARLDTDQDGSVTVADVKRYAELRAQAEAEADWMHPDEVRKAVEQSRDGDGDDKKTAKASAAARAYSDDDDDDDIVRPADPVQPDDRR